MYAIIRSGGKQAKVQEGDILDVEHLRDSEEVEFTPLLVVLDDGTVISGRKNLAAAKVTAKIVGGSMGPKVDVFKYKAKTGYRRRQGHRQKYTQIEITKIDAKGKKPKKKAPAKTDEEKAAAKAKKAAAEAKAAAKASAEAEAPEAAGADEADGGEKES